MFLILKESVRKLGVAGDVVKVAPGYGRFLCRSGVGVVANDANKAVLEANKARIIEEDARAFDKAMDIVKVSDSLYLVAVRQASEDGRLFGSVSARDVARMLCDRGVMCNHRGVHFPVVIKQLGVFEVKVELHAKVMLSVNIHVVRSELDAKILIEQKSAESSQFCGDDASGASAF